MLTAPSNMLLNQRYTDRLAQSLGLRTDQAEIIQAAAAAVAAGDPPTVHYIVRQWAHVSSSADVRNFHQAIPFYQRIAIRQCKNRLDTLARNGHFTKHKIDRARHGEGLPHAYEPAPLTRKVCQDVLTALIQEGRLS